jgi:hypothetical protein
MASAGAGRECCATGLFAGPVPPPYFVLLTQNVSLCPGNVGNVRRESAPS